jgi:SET domain-containing protein
MYSLEYHDHVGKGRRHKDGNDLNDVAEVLDSYYMGNFSRYINHSKHSANCHATC